MRMPVTPNPSQRPAAMTAPVPGANAAQVMLLKLACDGDEDAFAELVRTYHAELRAHCYRMLGSVQDAEDAMQEALLRAWRGLPGFAGRGSVRAWLYTIATNAALDTAKHRSRREFPVDFSPAAGQEADQTPPLIDVPWLEPYPDRWLTHDPNLSPEAQYDQRESVELAFVVALQHLPPLQRAVLLLREVAGLSAAEISCQLGASAPSVNSALQRARAAVRSRLPARNQQSALRLLGDRRTRVLAERYASAFEQADINSLVSMLTEDAIWSMPPEPTPFRGREAISEFLSRGPLTVRWKHRPARASGQLAVACYLLSRGKSGFVPAVIDVLTLDGEKIAAVTAFRAAETLQPPYPSGWLTGAELFGRFGLPTRLP
jgi:RNA polymerase sigma-70 factor, ECF subfamily